MAERSTALPPRCGCTGANRRTCLIWPATELSVSAVPARAWVFLRQRRSRRELSLSNTKAASLRPSRPINLRPEATAISSRSTAVGRSTERAERTSDVTQIIRAGPMPRPSCTREEATTSLRGDLQVDEFKIIHARFPCQSPDMHFFGYRFRIGLKGEYAFGDICWGASAQKWTW